MFCRPLVVKFLTIFKEQFVSLEASMNRIKFTLWIASLVIGTVLARGDELKLISRTISWPQGFSPDLTNQLAGPAGSFVPAFVRFNDPLSRSNHQVLQAAGVQLQDFLGDNSYSVLLPTQSLETNPAAVAVVF